jgi:maltose O-acetyltransferase
MRIERQRADFLPWTWGVNVLAASALFPPAARLRIYRQFGFDLDSITIQPGCYFHTTDISIGRDTVVNHCCFVENVAGVSIGANTALAPFVRIHTSTHSIGPHSARHGKWRAESVRIGSGCWVGAGAVFLAGVTVGDGCVIGAGSVVTEDCEPDGVYAGTPARRVRDLAVGPNDR